MRNPILKKRTSRVLADCVNRSGLIPMKRRVKARIMTALILMKRRIKKFWIKASQNKNLLRSKLNLKKR